MTPRPPRTPLLVLLVVSIPCSLWSLGLLMFRAESSGTLRTALEVGSLLAVLFAVSRLDSHRGRAGAPGGPEAGRDAGGQPAGTR